MAIKFEKIKPGMTLYDVRKAKYRGPFNKEKFDVRDAQVKEVDPIGRRVLVSWSGREDWMPEYRATKQRANKPQQ